MRVVLLVGVFVAGCGRIGFDSVSGDFGGSNDGGLPPCTTAICQCDTDRDCPAPHMYCSAHEGEHTCDCVAGYGGSPCAWTGVVADPPIQNPSAWTTTGVIDPSMTQLGQLDPGLATLVTLQRLSQTITMPRRSLAEPLVLEISYIGLIEDDCVTVDLPSADVGKHWIDLTKSSAWTDSRSCLGAAMYAPEASSGAGVALPLQVMPTVSASAGIQIDHVEIVPAAPNECVTPGPVPNGDCEADDAWTFLALPNGAPDGTSAGFVAGVGSGGSRAAQLFTPHPCELAEASVPFSVLSIDDLPSPAIKFWFSATTGTAVSLSFPAFDSLVGTGSPTTFEACLSPNQRGTTGSLMGTIDGSGTCANVINWTAAFDDVAIVNEPGCGSDPDLIDPGFESGFQPLGSFFIPGVSNVVVVANAALAHTGNDSLRIGTTMTCGVVQWTTSMFPPASTSGGGPALEFYYRVPANAQLSFVARASTVAASVVQDNTWRRSVVCFDPQLAGRSESVTFELAGGSCGSTAEIDAYVDDLALVNDPTCPQ